MRFDKPVIHSQRVDLGAAMFSAVDPSSRYEGQRANYRADRPKRPVSTPVPARDVQPRLEHQDPADDIRGLGKRKIPATTQRPARGTNVRVVYARLLHQPHADAGRFQMHEGDVVFVGRSNTLVGARLGAQTSAVVAGTGVDRVSRVAGWRQVNGMLTLDENTLDPADPKLAKRLQSVRKEWQNMAVQRCRHVGAEINLMRTGTGTQERAPVHANASGQLQLNQYRELEPPEGMIREFQWLDAEDVWAKKLDIKENPLPVVPEVDWQAVPALRDWTPDGVLLNTDRVKQVLSEVLPAAADNELLLNVVVQGPCPVRNDKHAKNGQFFQQDCKMGDALYLCIVHSKDPDSSVVRFQLKPCAGCQLQAIYASDKTRNGAITMFGEQYDSSGSVFTDRDLLNTVAAWRIGRVIDTHLVTNTPHRRLGLVVNVELLTWDVLWHSLAVSEMPAHEEREAWKRRRFPPKPQEETEETEETEEAEEAVEEAEEAEEQQQVRPGYLPELPIPEPKPPQPKLPAPTLPELPAPEPPALPGPPIPPNAVRLLRLPAPEKPLQLMPPRVPNRAGLGIVAFAPSSNPRQSRFLRRIGWILHQDKALALRPFSSAPALFTSNWRKKPFLNTNLTNMQGLTSMLWHANLSARLWDPAVQAQMREVAKGLHKTGLLDAVDQARSDGRPSDIGKEEDACSVFETMTHETYGKSWGKLLAEICRRLRQYNYPIDEQSRNMLGIKWRDADIELLQQGVTFLRLDPLFDDDDDLMSELTDVPSALPDIRELAVSDALNFLFGLPTGEGAAQWNRDLTTGTWSRSTDDSQLWRPYQVARGNFFSELTLIVRATDLSFTDVFHHLLLAFMAIVVVAIPNIATARQIANENSGLLLPAPADLLSEETVLLPQGALVTQDQQDQLILGVAQTLAVLTTGMAAMMREQGNPQAWNPATQKNAFMGPECPRPLENMCEIHANMSVAVHNRVAAMKKPLQAPAVGYLDAVTNELLLMAKYAAGGVFVAATATYAVGLGFN